MSMRIAIGLVFLTACGSTKTTRVLGRVVDEENRPVAGARLSMGWLETPYLETGADGEFEGTLGLTSSRKGPLLALDPEGRRGGLAMLGWTPEPVTIVLKPLKRVRGRVSYEKLPEAFREWHAKPRAWNPPVITVSVPVQDEVSFLGERRGPSLGLVARRSLTDGTFEFALPAGEYSLLVGGYHHPLIRPLLIAESDRDVDVGLLEVQPFEIHKRSGVEAPEIQVNSDTAPHQGLKLADLRGKWVLLFFWDHRMKFNSDWLPGLIRLYHDRRADRGRFEIVALHNCDDVLTVSDLNMALFWDSQDRRTEAIPFPMFVDDDGKTFKAYGIERGRPRQSPTWYLINPQGKFELSFDTGDPVRFLNSKLDAAP